MSGPQSTILIIDDETGMREVLVEVLCCYGYAAVGAQDGHEALKILRNQVMDLTVVDLNLPGMSGEETVMAIREKYPDSRIMVMTGEVATTEGRVLADRCKACGIIYKPFTMTAFQDAIDDALRNGRSDSVSVYKGSESAE